MNTYPSFKYQLYSQKIMILVYYAVFVGMTLLFGSVNLISFHASTDSSVSVEIGIMSGLSAVTAIMAFVAGWMSFKENFGLALQNGVSRRSLVLGRMCATGAVCLILATADEAVTLVFCLLGKLPRVRVESISLFQLMYGGDGNWLIIALCSVAFSFFLLLAASAAGYFFGSLFYRLPGWGKIAVCAGGVFMVFFPIPLLKMLRDRFGLQTLYYQLAESLSQTLRFLFGSPGHCMVSCLGLFLLFSLFAWLLVRKTPLKRAN